MNEKNSGDTDIVGAISERFRTLLRNLLQGNVKRARSLFEQVRAEAQATGEQIAVQNFIEAMAQGQALRNAFINLPSAVPGIGTLISWVLISVEDFFTLDQSVTLILVLSMLRGLDPRNRGEMEELAILSIGGAYGLGPDEPERDSGKVVKGIMTRLLPQRYVNKGVNRWVKAFIRRVLPFRRKSRLLPAGFGIAMSAWDAYDTIVKVGRIALRELSARQSRDPGR
ncbi:MAG TPA: hypothetical protein PLT09_00330 [Deltaproteobacteria bacterium]|nr:hypothetical protein [Deltaproteobacteria bacterium]HPR54235.1 hypothetical protein [Deltaproteobacteria bacterium]HXK45854.1 hypothetical protein [Deltaproteobacteria bacterium]